MTLRYLFLQINVPVGNMQLNKADLSEIPRCECKPDQEAPCSSESDCLNRMLMYECNPSVCPAKEACGNQRFQKRQYPESAPYRTESRGWGLKTLVDTKKVSALLRLKRLGSLGHLPSQCVQETHVREKFFVVVQVHLPNFDITTTTGFIQVREKNQEIFSSH